MSETWNTEAERLLLADACVKSLWVFAADAYGLLRGTKTPWFREETHKPLCDWLEFHGREWLAGRDENIQKFLMLIWPRECGKTTVATRIFPMWLQLQDTNLSIGIGSESKAKAQQWFGPIRSVYGGKGANLFSWLFGLWESPDLRSDKEGIVHAARRDLELQDPSFLTWGVPTGLVGGHPDVLILDDPTSTEAISADRLWPTKVNKHIGDLYPVLKRNGMLILPGTRYGSNDQFGHSIYTEGAASITGHPIKGVTPRKNGVWHIYHHSGRNPDGSPAFPKVWSKARMAQLEKREPQTFATQVLNDPAASELNPIRYDQLMECYVDPTDVPKNLLISFHTDTAFALARKGRGDESVVEAWGHAVDGSGDVYFLEGVGDRSWRIEDFQEQLVVYTQKYRAMLKQIAGITLEMEAGGNQGTLEAAVKAWFATSNVVCPPIYYKQRQGNGKEQRKSAVIGYWINGNVHVVKGAPGAEKLMQQMEVMHEPNGADDWIDPMCDVFDPRVHSPTRMRAQAATEVKQPYNPGPFDEYLMTIPRGRVFDDGGLSTID